MYEKQNRYDKYYDKFGRMTSSEFVTYSDIYLKAKNENPCSEIYLDDPLEKQLDRLKKDGKLNGRVKTLPKRFLLTRRVA